MSSGASSSRHDLIQNAVLFLQDPKTQSSPLTAKIEFLQSKGLNESEIQDALSRSTASGSGGQATSQSWAGPSVMRRDEGYGMAPVPPRRDWRDLFVSGILWLSAKFQLIRADHGCSLRRSRVWTYGIGESGSVA